MRRKRLFRTRYGRGRSTYNSKRHLYPELSSRRRKDEVCKDRTACGPVFLLRGKSRVWYPGEGDGRSVVEEESSGLKTGETEIDPETASAGPLKQLKYEKPEVSRTDDGQYFVQKISETFSYGIFVKLREKEGRTLLVYWIGSSLDGADWREKAQDRGYDEAFAPHSVWWESFWGKNSVTLPDPLFEKNWYLTNYFLVCCSRKGDYHHDLNTQLSYYSYLKANHLEEREGRYYLPISSSPEIHDDHIEAFLTPNFNYDLALMRYLFTALSSLAEELENGAAHQLEVFWKYCCSRNGFHFNGNYRNAGVTSLHYRPFYPGRKFPRCGCTPGDAPAE